MKFEETEVWGFKHAVRGVRNPMNSWDRSDSDYLITDYERHNDEVKIEYDTSQFYLGNNDIKLMQKLIYGGPEHRKFMRQIMVSVDITAPLYWFKEFDTYKIGTTANSTSTMHKLASKEITKYDFEMDDYVGVKIFDKEPYNPDDYSDEIWDYIIDVCETLRQRYIETKDMKYWKELIRLLPESYLQTRTITMNYENLYSIVRQRRGHKLSEWKQFIDWAHTLPYSSELIFLDE